MKCPVCITNLNIAEKKGVEIDYCSKCRGVWIGRGELDKIIELSSSVQSYQNDAGFSKSDNGHGSSFRYKKKHKSLLSELFDF